MGEEHPKDKDKQNKKANVNITELVEKQWREGEWRITEFDAPSALVEFALRVLC